MKENNNLNITYLFFGLIFLFVSYLVWLMAKQMIGPIIFGCILAGVFNPLKNFFISKWTLSQSKASALTSLIIVLLVLVPLIFLSVALSKEALTLYQTIVQGLAHESVNDFLFGEGLVARTLQSFSELSGVEVEISAIKKTIFDSLKGVSGTVISSINSIAGNILSFLFNLAIMMIVVFGIFMEGEKLKKYI